MFYTAGLYHNEANASASGSRSKSIFPQPSYFGVNLLTEQRDFRLPFYIHDEAKEIRAKLASKKKPLPYAHIKTNKYYSRSKLHGEVPLCQCDPSSDCGEQCMNRILQYICDPKTCPCRERCTNVSLGKRPSIKTDVAFVSIASLVQLVPSASLTW